MSATRDIGMIYSSAMDCFEGGLKIFFFPLCTARVLAQFKAVARRIKIHLNNTSVILGNGTESMLNGSKILLV
jgi:hypothetical protein